MVDRKKPATKKRPLIQVSGRLVNRWSKRGLTKSRQELQTGRGFEREQFAQQQ
jgi:hypothetical protein